MQNLLIITATFPPTNAVDMHRVRLSLPYYRQFGWKPHVLTFLPECADYPRDDWLLNTLPDDVEIDRIWCPPRRWTQFLGLGAVGYRGWLAMRNAGYREIKRIAPKLIFFSTTSFPLMSLGPVFGRRMGIPYVLDFQDPWISDEGTIHERSIKTTMNQAIHRWMEPSAVRGASGLISVSDSYLNVLNDRYSLPRSVPSAVVPFGHSRSDIDTALNRDPVLNEASQTDQRIKQQIDQLGQDMKSRITGLYTGAYVVAMQPMISACFDGIRNLLSEFPSVADRFRLWFIGSHYYSSVTASPILTLARQFGIEQVVREIPMRIPYSESLRLQSASSFNLLFGSISQGYNPSKLFQLLQAGRPVLAVIQSQTLVDQLLEKTGGACRACVDVLRSTNDSASKTIHAFVLSALEGSAKCPPLNEAAFDAFSAEATTEMQAGLFDQAVSYNESRSRNRFAYHGA